MHWCWSTDLPSLDSLEICYTINYPLLPPLTNNNNSMMALFVANRLVRRCASAPGRQANVRATRNLPPQPSLVGWMASDSGGGVFSDHDTNKSSTSWQPTLLHSILLLSSTTGIQHVSSSIYYRHRWKKASYNFHRCCIWHVSIIWKIYFKELMIAQICTKNICLWYSLLCLLPLIFI